MTNNTDNIIRTNDEKVAQEALSQGKAVISDWIPPKIRTSSTRDERNYRKGYQEALLDIANAMSEGAENGVIDWLYNNANPTTLEAIKNLMLRWDE